MGALSLPNVKAEVGTKSRNNDQREGVSGLKALGVRELTYKTAFLACSVTATSLRVNRIDKSLGNKMQKERLVLCVYCSLVEQTWRWRKFHRR